MTTYDQLTINQKINFKATLQTWARYSIDYWGKQLDKKVYGVRSGRANRNKRASGALRRTWYQQVSAAGGGMERVMIKFLLYGRFVDMGVGKGVSHTDRAVARELKLGAAVRRRKPWYSKAKGYQIKRLREILAAQQIGVSLDAVETALTISINRNL